MANKPETAQLAKLPKWAQEYIRDIERDVSIKALNRWVDGQTAAPFYIDELECLGEQRGPTHKRRYVQGNRMQLEYAGVELGITLRDNAVIDLQWGTPNHGTGDVCFQPRSFQAAYLIAKANMRD